MPTILFNGLRSFVLIFFAFSSPNTALPSRAELKDLRGGVTRIEVPQIVGGKTIRRQVLIHAPHSIHKQVRYPVVFALHGNGGRHSNFLRPLQPLIDKGTFVGIYPEGHRRSWNLGKEASTADDVAFIAAIMQQLKKYRQLDTSRAFVLGVSNGAGMAHQLAIETDYFRAIAAIVSHLNALNLPGDQTPEVSVLQISGDRDKIVPYDGGDSPTGHLFLPAEVSSRLWARHNGIEAPPKITETRDGNLRLSYRGGRNDTTVIHYRLHDHGHGGFDHEEGGIYRLIWRFFQQQIPRGGS